LTNITINLADAFRKKKRDLVEKMAGRNETSKEPKLLTSENEPLEAKRIREKMQGNKTNLSTNHATLPNEKEKELSQHNTISNFANYKPGKGEPSKELLERLVYGKKANVNFLF
jgi:hypothetical protein